MIKQVILLFLLSIFITNCLISQSNLIQGRILDLNQNGIIGASIQIQKENDSGTTTNEEGFFKLEVKAFPVELNISHVAYEGKTIKLHHDLDSMIIILLKPKVYLIDELNVIAEKPKKSISKANKYSVIDYEIVKDKIVMLEYHGTFKKRKLSLFNLNGRKENYLELVKIKHIEKIYKGCNDIIYLLSPSRAYPFVIENNQFKQLKEISINKFNGYIKSCKLKAEDELYYLVEELNGLKNIIRKHNIKTKRNKVIRILLDRYLEHNYFQNPNKNSLFADKRTILNNDSDVNKELRRAQSESDFLQKIYFKPNYPINIFLNHGELILLNHPEKKIEQYKVDTLFNVIQIEYPSNKSWLKKIIQDQKTQKIYSLFKSRSKTKIMELDITSGSLKEVAEIDAYSYNLKKVRVHNGYLFYLKENVQEWSRKELIKQRI